METLHTIIDFCIGLYDTKITIAPYTFTILQYLLSCLALGILGLLIKAAFLDL